MNRFRTILALFMVLATAGVALADMPTLSFSELYAQGVEYSEKTEELAGERIVIEGFMAPPLKPDAQWFVLTRMPMAVCPFCETEAEWPDDIIYVKIPQELEVVRFNRLLEVEGELSLGMTVDEESGFVSLLRLEDAEYRIKR